MIALLQRQSVSKRTLPPVAARARSNGVRWSNRDISRAPRGRAAHGERSFLLQRTLTVQKQPPRMRAEHSFLRRQFVHVQRKRAKRAGERRWARIIQNAASHRGSIRRPGRPNGESQRAGGTVRAALLRVIRSPWLFIVIAAAAALAFAFSSLTVTGLPLVQEPPVLPAPAEADPALYGLLVPDQSPRDAAGGAPVTVTSLKVVAYKTQSGDTLSRIASRFRLNIDTIVSWNNIRDGRGISAGLVLHMPNADGLKYVVRRGDTLQGIARSWGVDFNGLLDRNMLASSVISVGQELFLPGARMNPNELSRILGNLFTYPVQGRISSYFGERADPFTGVPNFHNGIDIVNAPGTSIVAAMAGTVAETGFNYSYGNYVIVKHTGLYQTLYGHLTRSVVVRGQKIQQGDKIGELGTTGYSTGPHLHFSVFHNGQPVDPLRFLK
ncbi:MAG: M23 family metallopeptidase [Spirochaetia bacterium]|jgi:murein DD-endopeptidase MepM/ murein hydrolase activator NlpD